MRMSSNEPKLNFTRRIPEGDERHRDVCVDCGFINYENPKIVVGAVCSWGDKILLCRRAINPRKGHWTLPAGYLELQETPETGAARGTTPTEPRRARSRSTCRGCGRASGAAGWGSTC